MLNKVYPLQSYLLNWLKKEDKYSLQSPLIFNTYQNLFRFVDARKEEDLAIEDYRRQLLSSKLEIDVEDFGAGSKSVNTAVRKVADITRFSTSSRKFAQLYQYFCTLTPAETVLELGTCMGITSRYLSKVTAGELITFEGSTEIAKLAFPTQSFENIKLIVGKLNQTLSNEIAILDKIDFALIDANHTYEATLSYFELILTKTHPKSIIAIGDIHWSREMERAWKEIQRKPEVKLTIDFYECGLVFLDYPGEKIAFVLDF